MLKYLTKIFVFQLLFGSITFFLYLILYFLFEPSVGMLILPVSIIFTILSFIMYRFVLAKRINNFSCKAEKLWLVLYFVICTLITALFGITENDILNTVSVIFQQTYYLVSEIANDKVSFVVIFISFLIENAVKLLMISFPKKK